MLTAEMAQAGAVLRLSTAVEGVEKTDDGFSLAAVERGPVTCRSLVDRVGRQVDPEDGRDRTWLSAGAAVRAAGHRDAAGAGAADLRAAHARASRAAGRAFRPTSRSAASKRRFEEALLFTHRGLSGPAILQISSYWREGDAISVDFLPGRDAAALLREARASNAEGRISRRCSRRTCPKRLAQLLGETIDLPGQIGDFSDAKIARAAEIDPALDGEADGIGGLPYRRGHARRRRYTRPRLGDDGGARSVPGLYVIGEVVDVTGWLGGYNFQWAWSSGWAAGQVGLIRRSSRRGRRGCSSPRLFAAPQRLACEACS